MFKKFVCLFTSICLIFCLFVPPVFADEPDCLTNGHSFSDPPGIMKGFDGEIQGFPVKVSIKYCSKCKFYFHECSVLGIKLEYMSLTGFTGIDGELQAFLFTQIGRIMGSNASASQFQAGGGSASPGGVGRNPAGYVSEGTSNIGQSGKIRFVMEHDYIGSVGFGATNSYWCPHSVNDNPKDGVAEFSCSDSYMTMEVSSPDKKFCPDLKVGYKFVTPVAGHYSVISSPQYDTVCNGRGDFKRSDKIDFNYSNVLCAKGQTIKLAKELSTHGSGFREYWLSTFFYAVVSGQVVLEVEPITVTINKQTNITINNNTWNGNIYVDNSNNLTYIYPQYTTINENNETVTNISNNPIIYNQETKQYYTYDQTTNNYYYITYNAPTPTPTPTPDPTPTPSPDVPATPIVPDMQNLIIPKMNANSFTDEHGTWIASGSSKYSDVFDFFRAFDRSTSDIWETNVSPSYLQIEIPDPENYYIDGYIMRISKFNNRYSKDWTLQGSDDGETWDDLDKQTGQNLSDMEEHKYSLSLRKAYKYYRLNMSNYASSMCSLSHFNLLGYDAKDVVIPSPAPSPSPGPGGSGSGDTPSGGGSSWWEKLLDKLGSALIDGLLDAIKGILKLLFDLFSSILGWIIWLCSKVFDLFPFLPPGVGALLVGGVVVCFILAFIKFIRG